MSLWQYTLCVSECVKCVNNAGFCDVWQQGYAPNVSSRQSRVEYLYKNIIIYDKTVMRYVG